MKLVIWDEAWLPYAGEFASRLDSGWQVSAGGGDVGWLMDQLQDADAMVAVRLPPEALSSAGKLQAFLFPGAGLLMPEASAYPQGCPVANVHEHETPIAEYVLMTMLLHSTELLKYRETFRQGQWDGSGRVGGQPHGELAGRTVGIFGYGRIGQAIGARARAFGMNVAAGSKDPQQLPELLGKSDFFVIAAPLTPETEGRIGAAELNMLQPHAMLINVSRAEIVCEQALYDALIAGRLGGAALDVWYRYPPPGTTGHGSRLPFHTLPNVICTPHYSAWTRAMILRRIGKMADNLNRLARGEALERIVLTGTGKP